MPGVARQPFGIPPMDKKNAKIQTARHILKKVLTSILTIYVIITISFLMVHFMPGDVIKHLIGTEDYYFLLENNPEELERVITKYGLNDPLHIQYLKYLKSIATMDFGVSYNNNQPVIYNVLKCCKWTLLISVPTLILGGVFGAVLGIIAGWHPGGKFDMIMTPISLFMNTVPSNCIGILMLVVFSYKLRIFPISGMTSGMLTGAEYVKDLLLHMALPLIIMVMFRTFSDFMTMKSSVSQVRREDYTTTAAAKGLPDRKVLFKHVMRNAMLPYITSMCMQMGGLLSGSMIVETIFGWKGMGQLYYQAVTNRDFPTAQLCFLISAVCVVLATLLSDIVIALIDPRIKEKVNA